MSPTTIIKSVSENEKAEIGKGSSLSSSSKMRKEGGGGGAYSRMSRNAITIVLLD